MADYGFTTTPSADDFSFRSLINTYFATASEVALASVLFYATPSGTDVRSAGAQVLTRAVKKQLKALGFSCDSSGTLNDYDKKVMKFMFGDRWSVDWRWYNILLHLDGEIKAGRNFTGRSLDRSVYCMPGWIKKGDRCVRATSTATTPEIVTDGGIAPGPSFLEANLPLIGVAAIVGYFLFIDKGSKE